MLKRLQARRGEEGFTLVELLVVIVILGVLAAIVVFAVGGINNQSSAAACKADAASLASAEEAYFAQNGAYVLQAGLKSGGYIHDLSTLHTGLTVNNTSTPKTYDVGACTP